MLRNTIALIAFISIAATACTTRPSLADLPAEVEGYAPIYASSASAKQVTAGPARPTVKGGKIYTTGSLLFQVEQDSGIHIINYADPANPEKMGFIRSALCKELSVKNGYIYTNNISDLVVININNPGAIKEIARMPNVFPDLALQYPPSTNPNERIYFECADPSKGIVIGWEQKTLHQPKCWR